MMKNIFESFGFSLGQLQDIVTLINHIKRHNVPIGDFIKYVEEVKAEKIKLEKKSVKLNNQWIEIALECPKCSTNMSIYPVNTTPRNQVGEDLKSQWFCNRCYHAQYSKKSIKEILKERK